MRNPWVGLRPFGSADSDLFFGRERETQVLSNLVATLPTLIVYASSGTGKSSLLNAGLAPVLAAERQVAIYIHDPHDDITASVRDALAAEGFAPSAPLALAELLEAHWRETDRRAVVVIDQFEERLNGGGDVEEIFDAIAQMAHSASDAGCLVLSLREDYLGSLEPLMRRVPGLMDRSYRVPRLGREALQRAIYGPVEQVEADVQIEPALVDEVLADLASGLNVHQEPGEQRFEPGYFQIVWSTLWEMNAAARDARLTVGMYRELGGASRILKDFTSRILAELEPAQAQMFWAMSRYLVLPTGAKTALTVEDLESLLRPTDFLATKAWGGRGHWRARGSEVWLVGSGPERQRTLIRDVLARLTASRAPLFHRVIRSGREEYELLHDLLGSILLDWRQTFETTVSTEADATLARLKRDAERYVRSLGIRAPTERETSIRLGRARERVATDVEQLVTRARGEHDEQRLVAAGQELATLLIAFRSVGGDDSFGFIGKGAMIRRQAGACIASIAFEHPSPEVRRAFQQLVPFFGDVATDPTVPLPRRRLRALAIGSCAVGLSFVSFGLAYLAALPLISRLDIGYAWLTLGCAAALFAVVYGGVQSDLSPRAGLRERFMAALVPGRGRRGQPAARSSQQSRRIELRHAVFTWPLPAFSVTLVAVGLGALADAAGWNATPTFTLATLLSSLGVALGVLLAADV